MLHLQSANGIKTCDGLTRRDFLRAGAGRRRSELIVGRSPR